MLEGQAMLREKLDNAKLPPTFRSVVESAFAGRVADPKEVDAMIARTKEAQATADKSGKPEGVGGEGRMQESMRITGVFSPEDKAEIALLHLIAGDSTFKRLEGMDEDFVKERMPESHASWIRAGRPYSRARRLSEWTYEVYGGNPMTDRAKEATTTSTMTSIVKNTLNLMVAADYAIRHRWWDPIATIEEVDTIDQATLVRVFGLDQLDVVDEGAPYTELDWEDEEETAAFVKKGNFIAVTLETLLNDKLAKVRTLPTRLANSWYNTISSLVSSVFTVNTAAGPVLADTGALFNATAVGTGGGHANLLTTGLSFDEYGVVRTAMMKQTDQPLGAGERLLIQPSHVLVPVDLETTALQIRNSEFEPGVANNDVNPWHQKFEVIVVPDWTDADNWAAVADKNQFPAIYLIFLRGAQVPQLFTADAENAGTMFTNDTIRFKVRMLTFRFSATYDCAPVGDWRPLHKSNV
jgi:hypothetical protein